MRLLACCCAAGAGKNLQVLVNVPTMVQAVFLLLLLLASFFHIKLHV
jgi:hypothetical protein